MNDACESTSGTVPLDTVPSPMARYVLSDGDAVIRGVNDAFQRTFGAVPRGTTVAEWCDAIDLAAPETAAATLADAVADGERVDVDRVWLDGAARPVRLRAVPPGDPPDTDGVLMVTDIDPGTGTGVDAERIASVVSHDLRNPLDAALAHLEAARDRTADDDVAAHVESVLDAHDRMQQIIQDVLTLARGEGAIDPRDDVAIGEVAADAWTTVETDVATLTVADDLPRVEADPARLRRLLENLFRNSVEHGTAADPGAVERVNVRVEAGDEWAGFAVVDDGPGIDPADRERAFVPGYSSTERGTGLGLTIVERIAAAHGWVVGLGCGDAGGARVEIRVDGGDGDEHGDGQRPDTSGGSAE
jgi:signal transduction histidine kinase